jgi:2-polyprenyl-6-methoxyphenol hydroxylase-like FAD-dependent oxidoreductase
MIKGEEISVLGGGIGGLAVATALAQRGASVRVLEQAPAITEIGAGLQVSPNGVAVLDALGLGDAARALGVHGRAVSLRDGTSGRQVMRLDLARWAPDQTYLYFHRADLVSLLENAARAAGVEIELGRRIDQVTETSTGYRLSGAEGHSDNVGLLIGADGLYSRLRPVLNGTETPFFTGQTAWRALVPAQGSAPAEAVVHMGKRRHMVSYPLRGGKLVNIVAVAERQQWSAEGWNLAGDPLALRQCFDAFRGQARALLAQVEEVSYWGLFRHPVAARWYGNNAALLGDAAHPTLPFLAQGANMALEDAWVLADCLERYEREEALPRYQQIRRNRVVRVIEAANSNAQNYHLSGPKKLAAHAVLRLGGALAPRRVLSRFDWIYRHDVTRG